MIPWLVLEHPVYLITCLVSDGKDGAVRGRVKASLYFPNFTCCKAIGNIYGHPVLLWTNHRHSPLFNNVQLSLFYGSILKYELAPIERLTCIWSIMTTATNQDLLRRNLSAVKFSLYISFNLNFLSCYFIQSGIWETWGRVWQVYWWCGRHFTRFWCISSWTGDYLGQFGRECWSQWLWCRCIYNCGK